ncbi:MAG: hypothetical protein DWQ05_02855 [Calditrichaeota bacterium]|nr:MAG: hypothetical protein DWQ05_02855 [Calditrichota bacterium]
MDSSYQVKRFQINCPASEVIEKILLQAYKNPVLMQVFEEHFVSCSRCQKFVKNIRTYYEILEAELEKPISAKVARFADSLGTGCKKS